MTTYNLVKKLLEEQPELRDSDKKLMWTVWRKQSIIWTKITGEYITEDDFVRKAMSPESCRRARQLIQARFPELRGSKWVQAKRKQKEDTKGTFIYSEVVESVKKQELEFKEQVKPVQTSLI